MTSAYKDVVMIGSPNGAGKTTTAMTMLPKELRIQEFVNADEIAHGLSPFNPEGSARAAGRLMIERIHGLINRGESFAFETTCSGRAARADIVEVPKSRISLDANILVAPVSKGSAEACCKASCPGRASDTKGRRYSPLCRRPEKPSAALPSNRRHRLYL
jgi:hypothetical protein